MKALTATKEDLIMMSSWCAERTGGCGLHPDWYTGNHAIAVRDDSGTLRAVMVLYCDLAGHVGQIGWTFANPRNTSRQSAAALNIALDAALLYFKQQRVTFIMSYIAVKSLNKLMQRHGFFPGDRQIEQMVFVNKKEIHHGA